MSTSQKLVEFRTAYLRAIARAWDDGAFREELLKSDDVFRLLRRDRLFDSPWPQLELRVVKSDDCWEPVETAGWVGGIYDQFVVRLPSAPREDRFWAEALAAYYQQFPTFLGPENSFPTDAGSPLPEGLGVGGPENFLEFGGVILRALALGWKRPDFWRCLTHHESGLPALREYLGFNNPWNFNILFEVCEDCKCKWDETESKWTHLPKNTIRMSFPNPPDCISLRAIALTSYNNTGPQYPFSCI